MEGNGIWYPRFTTTKAELIAQKDRKMFWNKKKLQQHAGAAKLLGIIKDEFRWHIQKNTRMSEKDGIDFIRKAYKKHGLVNDNRKKFAIVAFGKNTKEVHYFPKGKGATLKPNTLILLDIWARLNKKDAPYADMTWMFYYCPKVEDRKLKVEKQKLQEINEKWKVLVEARSAALKKLRDLLKRGKFPRGIDVDRVAHDIIGKAGYGSAIKHTIGHSLGFKHPHGKLPGINWREYSPLLKNVGYTIEPGMYFENYGMRTEMDFYISKKNEIIVTTPIQKNITIIK